MASVLTAVLQYHLAWVSTVMPAGAAPSRAYLDKHSSKTVSYFGLFCLLQLCISSFISIEISKQNTEGMSIQTYTYMAL